MTRALRSTGLPGVCLDIDFEGKAMDILTPSGMGIRGCIDSFGLQFHFLSMLCSRGICLCRSVYVCTHIQLTCIDRAVCMYIETNMCVYIPGSIMYIHTHIDLYRDFYVVLIRL